MDEKYNLPKKENKSPKPFLDFKYLDEGIHENKTHTFLLDADIILGVHDAEYYENGIVLDIDGLVVDGNDRSINGLGEAPFFYITADNVTLKNISFKRGSVEKGLGSDLDDSEASAIKIAPNVKVTIENCEFVENSSKIGSPLIKSCESEVNLINSTFLKNHAEIIYSKNGKVNIDNCKFLFNNRTPVYSLDGELSVRNSCFINNKSSRSGGAISSIGTDSEISDSTFEKNEIEGTWSYGGAINNNSGHMRVEGCEFIGNSTSYRPGGAIYNGGKLQVSDCTFTKNRKSTVSNENGIAEIFNSTFEGNDYKAIFNEKTHSMGKAIFNIRKCSFSKNGSDVISNRKGEMNIVDSSIISVSGTGISNEGEMTIEKTKITDCENSAVSNFGNKLRICDSLLSENIDGAVSNFRGEVSITNSEISANFSDESGGAIDNEAGEMHVSRCIINDNSSSKSAGAISNNGDMFIRGCVFSNNISKMAANAVENNLLMFVENSKFRKNPMGARGFEIINNENMILKDLKIPEDSKTIKNKRTLLTDNEDYNECIDNSGEVRKIRYVNDSQESFSYLNQLIADSNGEIRLEKDIIFDIESDEFERFKNGILIQRNDFIIDGQGHTIDAQHFTRIFNVTGRNVRIKNLTLKNAYNRDKGGAISSINVLGLENCTIKNCLSGDYGGAVRSKMELTMKECTVSGNFSKGSGGAITAQNSLKAENCRFNDNHAGGNGGALNLNGCEAEIDKSSFYENGSKKDGGAIQNTGNLRIGECEFLKNTSKNDGGAISNYGTSSSDIINSKFKRNVADRDGGGMTYLNGNHSINSCTFTQNRAGRNGGAIFNLCANPKIRNLTFKKNYPTNLYNEN